MLIFFFAAQHRIIKGSHAGTAIKIQRFLVGRAPGTVARRLLVPLLPLSIPTINYNIELRALTAAAF